MFENIFLLLGAPAGGAAGGAGSGSALGSLFPFLLIFLVMYLLVIRPQSRKQKALKEMLRNITKGDKVITIGGIHGVVHNIDEKGFVYLKVDDNVNLKFNKESIATVLSDKAVAKTPVKATDKTNKTKDNNSQEQEAETKPVTKSKAKSTEKKKK